MKQVRFIYNNKIVLHKDSYLMENEPRRYKTIVQKSSIKNIEDFLIKRFGDDYKMNEIYAMNCAIILDAIINSPRFDEE